MTADLTDAVERLADNARPRDELTAELEAAVKPAVKSAKWVVVRQFTHMPDVPVSYHRFEWVAEKVAQWKTARDAARHGAYFNAKRADS